MTFNNAYLLSNNSRENKSTDSKIVVILTISTELGEAQITTEGVLKKV